MLLSQDVTIFKSSRAPLDTPTTMRFPLPGFGGIARKPQRSEKIADWSITHEKFRPFHKFLSGRKSSARLQHLCRRHRIAIHSLPSQQSNNCIRFNNRYKINFHHTVEEEESRPDEKQQTYFKLIQEPYTLNELYIAGSDKAHVIQ